MARYNTEEVKQDLDEIANQLEDLFNEYKIINLEEHETEDQDKVIKKTLEDIVQKTLKYTDIFCDPKIKPESDQEQHFLEVANLYKNLLGIERQLLNSKIKNIDPNQPGLASKISNSIYDSYSSFKRATGFESDDANILTKIVKTVFKPIGYFISMFDAATPDRWRIANTKQKLYLVAGVSLSIAGLAFIAAAIVLGVTSPMGVITGIGVTVAWGAVGLGLAATICVGIGGVILEETKKAINKNIFNKNSLQKLDKQCIKANTNLDKRIEVLKASDHDFKTTTKPEITFNPRNEPELAEVHQKITKLQARQQSQPSFRM